MKLTKRQRSILIGTVLGDAYLQKTGARNARLRFEHSIKQDAYLNWKVSQFPKLFQGKPSRLNRKHPESHKTYGYIRHQSNATPELGKWRRRFYQDGKKVIPSELGKYLKDPLSLAIWYLDDGYYYDRDRVSYIYLGRVTLSEANIASDVISANFNLTSKVLDKKTKGFALYFSPSETKNLHQLIQGHVIPEMNYKLGK